MEALKSSCSKAIVDKLGSYSPRGAAYVSNQPKICFSPNDKKGCNFRFLKLVQNKGICPIHVVSSNTQMELDNVELQDLETSADEPKVIHVKFQLQHNCNFGEQFLLVGDDPIFGSWDPSNALPMTWSEGHIWTVEQNIPAGKSIQFKFILKRKDDIIWQPGSDRVIHTWESMNRVIVFEDWENAQLQKIIEEDQHAPSDMEHQIDSEMSSFANNLAHPEEDLGPNILDIEDNQTHAMEKPHVELDKQHISADNISSSMKMPRTIVAKKHNYPC